jgi:DNA repair photolyase
MFIWPDLIDNLQRQLASKRPNWGAGKTIVYSMLTDGFSPRLVSDGTTEKCLSLLLDNTQFRIRILTKNAIVGSSKWLTFFKNHTGRFVVGLSIGTLDDLWARKVETFTPRPTARVQALHALQEAGIPTYGMMCPMFPEVLQRGHLERLIDAIRPNQCETVWAEPFNDRSCWKLLRDSLPAESPTARLLTAVYEEKRYADWSRYATDLYLRLAAKAEAEGWLDKLKYLLYEDLISESDARHYAGFKGVLLQSKPDDDGISCNPAIAALQE